MLHFQIQARSGLPAYRQLMEQIKFYVASGSLKPNDQLPSIRELAHSLVVNPSTIVKAFSELEHAGLIEIRHGKGAFIAEPASRIPSREREAMIRPHCRQLAVEAVQMKLNPETVLRLVKESLEELNGKNHL